MPKKTAAEEFVTVREAAALKGVPVQTLYKAIERGKLAPQTVFGKIVLRRAQVEAYAPRPRRPARPAVAATAQEAQA